MQAYKEIISFIVVLVSLSATKMYDDENAFIWVQPSFYQEEISQSLLCQRRQPSEDVFYNHNEPKLDMNRDVNDTKIWSASWSSSS